MVELMSDMRHCQFITGKAHKSCAPVAERLSALPPVKGASMAEPTLEYRIWQRGTDWHWQVIKSELKLVIKSGVANSSTAARGAAFRFCREVQENGTDPNLSA